MIINSTVSNLGPGMLGILYCASIWVFTIFLVLCHRSGIQIVGAFIALTGFLSIFFIPHVLFSLALLFLGCMVHWFGRMLYHLRNR